MRLTKRKVISILATISIFGVVISLAIMFLVIFEAAEIRAVKRQYVLTTLTSYPENLHEFGTVLRFGDELAEKILSSNTVIYADVGEPLGTTIFVVVDDYEVTPWGLRIYAKLRTACLGNVSPACLVKAQLGEPVVVLGSEEVGHIRTARLDVPELKPLIIEVSGVDEGRAAEIANRLIVASAAVPGLGFVAVALTCLESVLPDPSEQSRRQLHASTGKV